MSNPSRRTFLKTSAAAAAAGAFAAPAVHAAGGDTLKVALIGCGGRGGGAALNTLHADPNVKLWAACDVFPDRISEKLAELRAAEGGRFHDRIDVTPDRCFDGFDGYKHAIDSGADVVILATSPGFRPIHLAYAVEKNKHVFMEKPHAVDATGVRSVLESARLAEKKGLGLCGGFTYRYDPFKRETVKRLHGGAIGDVLAIHTTYLTGEIWDRSGKSKTRDPHEMEYQIRMWYYFNWLSGDFLVEQAIHNVDKAAWVMNGEMPVAATGMGGRQVRTAPKFGNIYDHFTVVYEYAGGAKVFLQCRQIAGCKNGVIDHVIGSKGTCELMDHTIKAGGTTWKHPGEHSLARAYDLEHEELYASIRAGKPMNDGVRSAMSTLMGIMGREAAYTGQRVTWKQMLESKQSLLPKEFAWGPNLVAPVAMPGKTKFV
jgi:myo-inositol 2-dehydrogenase/D-chiro-inositol 1-dehydrogenase